MSVVSANLIESECESDANGERTYRQRWEVLTNDKWDGPLTVLSSILLPQPGDVYTNGSETDLWAFVQTAQAKRKSRDKFTLWNSDYTFSTKAATRDNSESKGDPLDEPPKVSGSFIQKQVATTQDKDGNVLKNSAGQPFNAVMIDDPYDSLVIEYNASDAELELRSQARNRVNSATIWGLGARVLKLVRWDWHMAFTSAGDRYFPRKLEFLLDQDGWKHQLLDAGTAELDDDDNLQPIRIKGELLRHDVPLDGNGHRLPVGDDEVYLEKLLYKEFDFAQFGLPNPLW